MLSFQEVQKINEDWILTLPAEQQRKYQPRQGRRVRTPRATCTSELQDAIQSNGTDFGGAERASRALQRISVDRCERYETWIAVGMALCELGRVGFVFWDEWSKGSSKYNPTECADKWPTFTPGTPGVDLTLASLDAWANEDSSQDMPTDGCQPDCPNRPKLAAHQATIRQLEQEVTDLRDRNRFVSNAQGAKNIKSASLRDTVVELQKELERVPLEDRDPDAFVPVRPALMASYANSSPSTVSRHLKRLEDHGLIERKVDTIYLPDEDKYVSQTSVRARVDLTDPRVLIVPSQHGGSRVVRCIKPDCNSTNIIDKVQRICLNCNTPQGDETFVPVNNVEDLRDVETYRTAIGDEQKSASGQAIASCLPNSNEPSTTNSMVDLQELHLATAPSRRVPSSVIEAHDLTSALLAADNYSPSDDQGRFAYKSGLAWLNRHEPIKAESLLDRIKEPMARAIMEHLIAHPLAGSAR